MKKMIFTLAILFSGLLGHGVNDTITRNELSSEERNVLVSLTAKHVQDNNYFNLQMLNESKGGFYSLVREYTDGTFESVALKEITVNNINTPLLYSFVDDEVPQIDFIYVLYRISAETEELQRWAYNAATKELQAEIIYAVNL